MRNFYLSCKFCTLTINLSEAVLPGHIPPFVDNHLWKRTTQKRVECFSKTCSQEQFNLMIRLEDILKMSWRRFSRRLEDVLKTSWKRLENVLKTYRQDEYIGLDQDVLKTSSEDVRLRRTYSSWSRRLEDVLKTSSEDEDERRLQDVFKTSSSRRIFAGK